MIASFCVREHQNMMQQTALYSHYSIPVELGCKDCGWKELRKHTAAASTTQNTKLILCQNKAYKTWFTETARESQRWFGNHPADGEMVLLSAARPVELKNNRSVATENTVHGISLQFSLSDKSQASYSDCGSAVATRKKQTIEIILLKWDLRCKTFPFIF